MSLRTAELAQLRADIEAQMTESCAIYHRTIAPDGQGGSTITIPATPSATVACRRVPVSSREQIQAGGTPLVNIERLQVPYNAPIVETDVLVIGSDSFEVTGILDREPHTSVIVQITRIK